MNAETKLIATVEQAKEMQKQLQQCIKAAEQGSTSYVSITLEKMQTDGSCRLLIGVVGVQS